MSAVQTARVAERPSELVIRSLHEGDVECDRLTVVSGGRLLGKVRAREVLIERGGQVRGTVRSFPGAISVFRMDAGGSFCGEVHVTSIEVAGKSSGILHGQTVRIRQGSDVSGAVIADTIDNDGKAKMQALVFTGPGVSGAASKALLEGVRALVNMPFLSGRTAAAPADERPASGVRSVATNLPASAGKAPAKAVEIQGEDDSEFDFSDMEAELVKQAESLNPVPSAPAYSPVPAMPSASAGMAFLVAD